MDNDIIIQNSIATWTMKPIIGELGGTYTGTFVFRCYLSPMQVLEAGREYRSLLGELGSSATNLELNLAFSLTQLKQRIIKAPPFWTSTKQDSGIEGNVGDTNVIIAVLMAAERAEAMFKENIQKERDSLLSDSIKAGEELRQKQEL